MASRSRNIPDRGLPGKYDEYFDAATLLYVQGFITDAERMKIHNRMKKRLHKEHPDYLADA